MKIEEGRFYKRNDGSIVGPARRTDGADPRFEIDGWYYMPDGELCGLGWGHEASLVDAPAALDGGRKDDPDQPLGRAAILEAARVATVDRGGAYGDPEDNFSRIANLWNAHCHNRGMETDFHVTDVALMLALMKVARLANNSAHPDSWADIAGYAACGGEIAQKQV